jgi:acetolactate decarboxylase
LEKAVQRHAKAKSINLDQPLPFLLTGTVIRPGYHVIHWREGATHTMKNHKQFARQGELRNVPVQLLGFYSAHHHGVFTHHTTNMHIHIINAEKSLVGHLNQVSFPAGVQLLPPK